MRRRREAIDQGLWRAGRTGGLVSGELGSGMPRGEKASLANEEAVGGQAQGDVVVQAAPGASLEVAEPDLLLRRHAETTETFECHAGGVDFDLR